MLGHHHQSVSAASQHLRRFPSYDLRLTTYDFLAGTHHHHQPTTTSSLTALGKISTTKEDSQYYYTTILTTKHTPAPLGLCVLGDVRSPPPPVSLSSQPIVTTYDLRLTTYDLRLTTYDLQLTTYDIPALLYWDPPPASSLSVQYLSQEPASQHLLLYQNIH